MIGSIAMLYKFLNIPFFSCHLVAIFLLGLAYDLVFSLFKIKSKALLSLIATYLGYTLFALTATYIFKYDYWMKDTLSKMVQYIAISGTLAAFANSICVLICFRLGQAIKEITINPFEVKSRIATVSISLITLFLWFSGIFKWF